MMFKFVFIKFIVHRQFSSNAHSIVGN
eukprot:CCRYP_012723-RA/>CCRYP_012723-RA protein AED:0.36 eAED:0.56 QI:92/0.5/0.66/1/0/0/3/107/26